MNDILSWAFCVSCCSNCSVIKCCWIPKICKWDMKRRFADLDWVISDRLSWDLSLCRTSGLFGGENKTVTIMLKLCSVGLCRISSANSKCTFFTFPDEQKHNNNTNNNDICFSPQRARMLHSLYSQRRVGATVTIFSCFVSHLRIFSPRMLHFRWRVLYHTVVLGP